MISNPHESEKPHESVIFLMSFLFMNPNRSKEPSMADYRGLFKEIMFYGEFDRMPVIHWCGWPETRQRWISEGLPESVSEHAFFDAVPMWAGIGVDLSLFPVFETEVLEETEDYTLFRGGDGVVCKDWKHKSCIPHYIDFTLKTARDWPLFKERLQPDERRIPKDIDLSLKNAKDSGLPIVIGTASLMGWIRNWMGVENMSYLLYDDPDCYADMVMTLADLVCWQIDLLLPKIQVDMGFGWEDICGRSGPLVSPSLFERHVAPGYRKIKNHLEHYGVHLYGIDSDGDVRALVKPWLDSGVNVQFPVEVGPFQGDAWELRAKYGKELRIIGNLDKLVLEKGEREVDAEIERLLPLMREGGFIPMPDHLITPGVSLASYQRYLEKIRKIRL